MMTKIQNTKNNEKMAEYCKTCVCKSCEKIAELKAYKDVNEDFKTAWEELKAENDRLKEEIKEVKKYQYEQEYLEKEIERLKAEIKNNKSAYQVELGTYNMECGNLLEENKELAHYLACMTEQRNRANTCLQEIKAIVKNICDGCTSECDCDEDCNYFLIIEQLTKAEEE